MKKITTETTPIEYKFILLGDMAVGKTSIFRRLSGKSFEQNLIATVGVEKNIIDIENVKIDEKVSQNFKISLFDTSGQERFRTITRDYFRNSQGIILLYSIVNKESYRHIQEWLKSIKESLSDWKKSEYMIMLLANKLDIAEEKPETRMILVDEPEKLCKEEEIFWGGECSAKTNDVTQLKEILIKFIKQIHLKLKDNDNYKTKNLKQKKSIISNAKKKKTLFSMCYSPDQ